MSDAETKTDEEDETDEKPSGPKSSKPHNVLSRPGDAAARPGFRNPANVRSKASKAKRKGKKRR